MESNPLLAALQSNYGDGAPPPPDTNTVRGLLAFCKLWLEGETPTDELNNPCMAMSSRLAGGARETEADLRQNPDLVASARAPIERTASAYWKISSLLDRLPGMAAENDVQGFQQAIEEFEKERQVVLDCNAEIERSLSGDVKLCPRCGDGSEGDVCRRCELVKLYPDPGAGQYDRGKTAMLPPVYAAVNEAYDAVMSGKRSLPTIFHSVDQLDQHLIDLQKGYEQAAAMELPASEEDPEVAEFEDGKELANKLLDYIDDAFAGIDRIRNVEETLRMSDLSRGWDTIFDAAVDMQRATQRFAKAHGHMEFEDESDSVQFSGE